MGLSAGPFRTVPHASRNGRSHGSVFKDLIALMKAFLLAAGNGTRLRPLTDNVPKCLLPICGVPLLEIWLNNCKAAGITDVLVNTHAHAEGIRRFIAEPQSGVKIRIAEEQ